MPGLIGFCGRFGGNQPRGYLERMARALEPEHRFRVELYQEHEIALGHVGLGVINAESQPVWNEDKSLGLMMEGELFGCQELRQDLIKRGHQFRSKSDAELALHLYEEYRDEFATKLNGGYLLAIWDRRSQRLLLVDDHVGQYPLYYSQRPEGLLFASGVRALMGEPGLRDTIDKIAIAQLLTFGHALGDHTLLTEVRRLPPASLLIFADQRVNIRRYWQMRNPDHYRLRDEKEWMDGLEHHLRQAVTRQAPEGVPAAILLSGGIDSRILLAYLADIPAGQPVQTFTWGIPGCDDARFAAESAAKAGMQHHFLELKPDWLLSKAEDAVRITDGMGNIINLHALANLEEEAKYARIIYKGFMGDGLMGYSLRHQHWASYDDETRIRAHFQVHRDQGAVLYEPAEHAQLFTDAFRREVGTAVLDEYRSCLSESGSALLSDQRTVFGLRQRVPRMALNGVEVVRSQAVVRLPFCDRDLIDFALTVPPGLRYERRLVTNTFSRAFPELAKVPIAETGLPMMDCGRALLLRIGGFVRWHLHNRGFGSGAYPKRRPYQDYNAWFRTILRDWVEGVLLSQKTLCRGYFNPTYIRQLVNRHMTGVGHSERLGVLISLELWHRQFTD